MGIAADIAIEDPGWDEVPDAEALVETALGAAAAACGIRLMPGAAVSVLLAGDGRIREINKEWRGLDKPTNVLSFAALPPERLRRDASRTPFLGDIALALGVLQREAAEEGKPLRDHILHLVVHGFLHLVGYDHETEAQAAEMEGLETRILAGLGVPDPYGSDAEARATAAGSR
ncbi:rRNA maturation RNase YbeY [Alsobacter sp. R-9]